LETKYWNLYIELLKYSAPHPAVPWEFVEHVPMPSIGHEFKVGNRVRVKDNVEDDWRTGVIEDVDGPVVLVDGWDEGYSWEFVEHLPTPPTASIGQQFRIGDRVKVKDDRFGVGLDSEFAWKKGVVQSLDGKTGPVVLLDGWDNGHEFEFVEHL